MYYYSVLLFCIMFMNAAAKNYIVNDTDWETLTEAAEMLCTISHAPLNDTVTGPCKCLSAEIMLRIDSICEKRKVIVNKKLVEDLTDTENTTLVNNGSGTTPNSTDTSGNSTTGTITTSTVSPGTASRLSVIIEPSGDRTVNNATISNTTTSSTTVSPETNSSSTSVSSTTSSSSVGDTLLNTTANNATISNTTASSVTVPPENSSSPTPLGSTNDTSLATKKIPDIKSSPKNANTTVTSVTEKNINETVTKGDGTTTEATTSNGTATNYTTIVASTTMKIPENSATKNHTSTESHATDTTERTTTIKTDKTTETPASSSSTGELNKTQEPKMYSLGTLLVILFCSFGAGILVAVVGKMMYDNYNKKRTYVVPPEQDMQLSS